MIWTHVSELAIDRLLAGEVAPADAAAMRDHAAGCATCRARLADALAVQREFARARPRLPLPRRRIAPVLATAAAFAATLAILWSWPRAEDAPATIRTKGTPIIGFFVAHGDQVRRGGLHETVTAGDRLQLFTTAFAPGWFAAISRDAAGQRSIYVAPRRIEVGRERVVPLSIELDDVLGIETVTGVFCPDAFDASAIDFTAPPPGCTLDRFTLVKVAR